MRLVLLALFLIVAALSPAFAGEAEDAFKRAVTAYKAGDHATALREFRAAAELGTAPAQFNLGLMHANGQGTPKDEAEAVRWWRKAAEGGLADAQNNLGLMYEHGRGVTKNLEEAVRWYRAAAIQRKPHAQHNLGAMYANGRGVERDLVRAHMWFELAASGHEPGPAREETLKARDLVAAQLTEAERAEAARLTRDWSPEKEAERLRAKAAPEPVATQPAERDPAKARIAAAQAALKKLGYNPGPADGIEGPRTRAAVSAFQRDVELPETGRLTDDVIERLRILVPNKDTTASSD